ncbi:hypothetical protein TREMEDRAFT_45592 [Tremella mesenterica DSM 1558]|uniref:uncharacterized protein n=1 Tax=Tremella mesenterica (strain ATCC 24925 / CBS 8224 / DSM 1558 / NBRC 9311 / NRRL Y-6157 / RJB 2259-6 / UBC 559-6) TaxID=578456 RepID=UPI00032BA194|nr:uncharacterized protein TREMEDRAFT_45592 [Tremella mesenterica DSM 1558]EIW66765.1 hypothetical protein TREMEDRAFT_45592 [Tremella mesenterica DSM 1558]
MTHRPEKRTRKGKATGHAGPSQPPPSSRLFAPFRALGHVSNHVPFSMFVHSSRGALAKPSVNIVTSIGRSWMMWEAGRMGLLFVGPDSGEQITSLAQTGTDVYAACGNGVTRYLRGKAVGRYESGGDKVGKILIFGEQLVGLTEDGGGLLIWDIQSKELVNKIQFPPTFKATVLLHPATYLNKILIGDSQGQLALYNTRTCSLIHNFTPTSSPITALVQSPAIDVVGVGHLDGTVDIYDIREGESIMQMKMDDGGISALSFRMDGVPVLAAGSTSGSVALWDLSKEGRILHVLRGAHEQSVGALEWVPGQPLFITSSGDNTVKQWLCDSPDSPPRLLKHRGGHHSPPTLIRYYGTDGKQILTSGRDRSLRYTSVVRDSRSHELSQGQSFHKRSKALGMSVSELKLAPITALSSCSIRSKDWDDVLTAHQDEPGARTWKVLDKKMGGHLLEVDDGVVQAVCVSACGNFGIIGSSTGEIKMWNMQSGKHRRTYHLNGLLGTGTSKVTKKSKGETLRQQGAAITGLATDALNTVVVASTIEGKIYFFDFHTTKLLHRLALPSPITALDLQRDSGLLSATCDDLIVRLVDVETRRVVRELRGFKGRILDTTFSPDSRWLIAASLDSAIRTFDIPTGRLIDAFQVPSIPTSLTFSPTGDFLATSHVDSLGVHLWANRAQFTDVPLKAIDEEAELIQSNLPSVRDDTSSGLEDLVGFSGEVGLPEFVDSYETPEQLEDGLVTLSLMPRSRWQTLLNLDTIRERNKPKVPPKAPEKAPFFLPTVSGLETRFDLSTQIEGEKVERIGGLGGFSGHGGLGGLLESEFTKRLEADGGDYTSFFTYLKSLSPSNADLEIRSLSSLSHLSILLTALTARLASKKDYEAVHAFTAVFLQIHGDVLVGNSELLEGLVKLREAQREAGKRIGEMLGYAQGTLTFLRGGI